ncbi:hypothetical protein D3C85_1560360 [compost metagenome]
MFNFFQSERQVPVKIPKRKQLITVAEVTITADFPLKKATPNWVVLPLIKET